MNLPVAETQPTKTAIAFAGEELPVRLRVEREVDGVIQTETVDTLVRVRAMPARHLGRVLQLCTDEGALLDFICQERVPSEGTTPIWQPVPPHWSDNLDDEHPTYVELLEAAKRLNFSRAAAWGKRQIAAKQYQAPILAAAKDLLTPIATEMVASVLSSLRAQESSEPPATTS